ncbi:MAG: SDR family NAD(P)-dependent oxidoreductase, partial [Clostridium celatum]|nr:SDR family NAD(P)-dependent oxidoreductase [Clostridium celatum]
MVQKKGAYTVITGASSGIGDETAKAFAARGRNLVVAARRQDNLEALKKDILSNNPALDVVVRATDLSVMENVYQFYESLKEYPLDTWINNAGFGNYDSVAHQDLRKIESMLHLNVEALTILSSLFVRDYKDTEGTQLINISS